jgi:mRNA interferase MazF
VEVVAEEEVRRGEVLLVDLGPARGGEIRKTRPCVVVSPDELNEHLRTFIVAPLTTGGHRYPFRVACRFAGKAGHVVLDQIRTVDQGWVIRRLGRVAPSTLQQALSVLQEMFAA